MSLRHLKQLPQDFNQWTSIIFWPILDIALFGFVGVWFHQYARHEELAALIAGVTLWQVVARVNFDVSISLLEEAWSHNALNLFATPLSITEWLLGVVCKGLILGSVTLLVNIGFVWLTFGFNLLSIGVFFFYTIAQLIISGLGLGLIGAGLLFQWGPQIQTLIFIIGFIACPVSGAFYPVSILPTWLEQIAYALPFAYIFEGLFTYIQEGMWHTPHMLYATALNVLLIAIALMYFYYGYNVAKQHGIANLAD